ncbi:NEDD8-conjugating protein ubc12 [Pichia californica]|uniref:NEDD8 carrier protein n=1 Tax=Pichia californica TaxID=460514 RepID=A0A9P6WHS9_9ASCO|nr:NEDD8-conjugating protein ubc12 [[Candida] californica]
MIRLKKLQQEKAAAAAAAMGSKSTNSSSSNNNTNNTDISQSVAFMRAKKDLQEYEEIPSVEITYDRNDPMHIKLIIIPDNGYYYGGKFEFECTIPENFPNSSPEFKCLNKIYHPNIDIEGHVCLNILRNDWKPTLTLQLVFAGILHLFLQPNPNDPLNKIAANDLAKFPDQFARHVRDSMIGSYVGNEKFDRVITISERNNYNGGSTTSRYNRSFNNFY